MPEQEKFQPKIVGKWDGKMWIITLSDEDGKSEISPRMRNLFKQTALRKLRQRYRELRVRQRMAAAGQASLKV